MALTNNMGYSLTQLQSMGATPVNSGQSLQQLQGQGATPVTNGFPTQEPSQVKDSFGTMLSGAMKRLGSNVAGVAKNIGGQYMDSAKKIVSNTEGAFTGQKAPQDALLQNAGEVAKSAFAPITETVKPIISGTADAISNNKTVQKIASSKPATGISDASNKVSQFYQNWSQQHPEAAKNLEAGVNIGQLLLAAKPVNAVGDVAENTAKSGLEAVKSLPGKVTDTLQNKYTDQALAEWQKPTIVNKPTYNKPTDIFNNAIKQGNDIAQTLVKNKIKLSDNIDNGNYATTDTAAKIRADAAKMSNEGLRPSLQMADYTTPKTPVSEILNKTISDIKKSVNTTPGDVEAQVMKAQKEASSLQKKYPNGMSLTDMHDNKITYASNGKYSPVGDTNVNNTGAVNRAFGRTMAGLVESKAPEDVPVHQFNAELQKQYQAADYLDALNNKKIPQSIASKVAKTSAKVVGAAIGEGLGGGILGGVGGYHIGGMVESMIENLPNPIKGHFLDNLSKTNPEAFKAVQDYMGAEQVGQLTRKALPAPDYIEAQPKTPPQGATMEITPAAKGLPGRDLKTGRMFKTYKTTSK
jgi:hypothetical protein